MRGALAVFFGAAILGAVATLVTGGEPGSLLGNLIILGAVVAALVIDRRGLYLLIPMPALTYLVLAVLTGLFHDRGSDTSVTQLGLSFLQWVGNGFLSMCAATILVVLVFGARLLASRQLVSGSFPMSAERSAAGRAGGAFGSPSGRPDPRRDDRRRTARAPWDDEEAWYDAPRGPGRRDDRDRRDGRDSRDRRGIYEAGDDFDSRPAQRPDRRKNDGWSTDGWRVDNPRPRPGARSAPPDRGGNPPRGRDPRDNRGSRGGRSPWDGPDPRGR